MFVVKVYCKIETSPWALTLTEPELPASDFSGQWAKRSSRVTLCFFLHDVAFLIDRHSCVERSTGTVSREKFQNKMLTTHKNYNLNHGYKKQTLSDEFLARLDLTVNFHHEHFIDPTNCPWVSEDGWVAALGIFTSPLSRLGKYLATTHLDFKE